MPELTVRTATPEDHRAVMECAMAACADNGLVEPNPIKLLQEIWPALNLDRGIVGVIGDDFIEAGILLRIDRLFYSDRDMLLERCLFVRPEFRKSGETKIRRARSLCEFAKQAADRLSLPLVIGILTKERVEGKIRLYEKEFGEPAGAYWIYEPVKNEGAGALTK